MKAKEAYEAIGIPFGYHFKYRKTECMFYDDRVLVYDYMFGDWIMTRHFTIEDVVNDKESVSEIKFSDGHYTAYNDTKEVWSAYIDSIFERRKNA